MAHQNPSTRKLDINRSPRCDRRFATSSVWRFLFWRIDHMTHSRAVCASYAVLAILLSGAMANRVLAQAEPAGQVEVSKEADKAAEDSGGFAVEGAITFPSSYVFRGYVLLEDHFIVQPEVTVSYGTHIGDITITPYFTAWANLTDASAPGDPEWFNELDLYLGADIELPEKFTLGIVYDYYNSPANFFDDIHELGLTLGHEDVFNPSVGIYREIKNSGADENTYIELGITPGFDVPQIQKLHLDFPLVLGLSPDEYYTKSNGDGCFFGYASIGVKGTYSLSDNWSLFASVDYVQMLADSTEASNKGDEYQVVGKAGVKFSY
jgi:hypothetical protein